MMERNQRDISSLERTEEGTKEEKKSKKKMMNTKTQKGTMNNKF